MIIEALALLSYAPAPPPVVPSDVEDEIVVVGRRLRTLSVSLTRDANDKLGCGLDRSSGNARLDAQLCEAAARCARGRKVSEQAMRSCIDSRKPALLAALAKTLRSKRY